MITKLDLRNKQFMIKNVIKKLGELEEKDELELCIEQLPNPVALITQLGSADMAITLAEMNKISPELCTRLVDTVLDGFKYGIDLILKWEPED